MSTKGLVLCDAAAVHGCSMYERIRERFEKEANVIMLHGGSGSHSSQDRVGIPGGWGATGAFITFVVLSWELISVCQLLQIYVKLCLKLIWQWTATTEWRCLGCNYTLESVVRMYTVQYTILYKHIYCIYIYIQYTVYTVHTYSIYIYIYCIYCTYGCYFCL